MSASARGYSNKWTVYAKAFLAKHPFCSNPFGLHTEQRPSTVVMHRVAHKGNMKVFWDKANHAPGCAQCNGYQCVKYEGGFGNAQAQHTA